MQLRRNEILTGLLVLATVAILTAVLILLGAPGLLKPLVSYQVYFDNAAGIKLGAPVLLAGRKIGQVERLYSPLTQAETAEARAAANRARIPAPPPAADGSAVEPKFEARLDVRVDRTARVYKDARVRLITLGLLGETAVDFTEGNEEAGRAKPQQAFAGQRIPDFGEAIARMIDIIEPVAKEATGTLKELQTTAQNLSRITDEQSQLNMALAQMRTFSENLTTMTAADSPLQLALKNVETVSSNLSKLTTDITSNDNIEVTLQNFRDSSAKLKVAMNELLPDVKATGANVKDLTDTLKHQPWRLLWPSTKKYPADQPPSGETITVRKSARSRSTKPAKPAPRGVLYPGE